ncbi:MAG TPA: cation diffusion facilitator family transporter, partial [Clostridiales bacterium]|nr:cation diffusion facilitator family transporter [Clostridiales bacterium]
VIASEDSFLTKLKNGRNKKHPDSGDEVFNYSRMVKVVLTSVVGILVNVALGIIKIIVGLASNSIAIISDAANNFIDSVSSIVTILTTALVGKGATRKHPFGFGRMEYFSSMIIAVLVLVTGTEFLINAVRKIINPTPTSYTNIAIILLAVAVLAKIGLGLYTKRSGKKYYSPNLIASGQDAFSDAVLTAVTLIAAIVSRYTDYMIDGWIGAVVSLFVIKSGIDIVRDVLSKLMGDRPDAELADTLMERIRGTEGIAGAYDLILHNYGPNIYIGNVDVELDEKLTIRDAYKIIHPLNIDLFNEYGVFFYFGFYSVNVQDEDIRNMRNAVKATLLEDVDVLQIHAFFVDTEKKQMSFDAVLSFDIKNPQQKIKELKKQIQELYPDYDISIFADRDFTLTKK